MKRLGSYFLRGLVITAPLAVTIWVVRYAFTTVDRWLALPIPGLGVVLVVAAVTLVGALATGIVTRSIVRGLDTLLGRLPFVRLLYSSTRDLLNAFVGEQRRFERAVAVSLSADGAVKAIGFVTRDALDHLGLGGHVAVYLPQSYNFAGNLIVVPADRVAPLPVGGTEAMAFVVSGGVSSGEGR